MKVIKLVGKIILVGFVSYEALMEFCSLSFKKKWIVKQETENGHTWVFSGPWSWANKYFK